MDKLIEKFNRFTDSNSLTSDLSDEEWHLRNMTTCANITKEVAIGFSEWIIDSGYSFDDHQEHETDTQGMWAIGYNEKYYTTSELFDIYLATL